MKLTAEEMVRHGPETDREQVLMNRIEALRDAVEELKNFISSKGYRAEWLTDE